MKEIKFWFYYLTAKSRGWNRSCNIFPKGPSVITWICKLGEIRTMYFRHGWIPYCIKRNSSSFIKKDLTQYVDEYYYDPEFILDDDGEPDLDSQELEDFAHDAEQ